MSPTKYNTGQVVPESGIYHVMHADHRLPHAVTICRDEIFPRCAKCADLVIFELLRAVNCPFTYEPMHVYELHPVREDPAKSASTGSKE